MENIIGSEEALAKLYLEMLSPKDDKLKTMTDVTPREVFGLPVLFMLGNIFKSGLTKEYCEDFMRLRISRIRSSRQELVFLGSGLASLSQDKKTKGLGDLFQGLQSR
jgi:hypothetical protein